jgi:hypothetical protein
MAMPVRGLVMEYAEHSALGHRDTFRCGAGRKCGNRLPAVGARMATRSGELLLINFVLDERMQVLESGHLRSQRSPAWLWVVRQRRIKATVCRARIRAFHVGCPVDNATGHRSPCLFAGASDWGRRFFSRGCCVASLRACMLVCC